MSFPKTIKTFSVVLAMMALPFYTIYAQNTTIPDANFEQALIDLGIDSDGTINGSVLTADINTVTELNVFNKNIIDLTGIQDFTDLERLNCSINKIQSLDLSSNAYLIYLNVSSNQLSSLDVSSNPALEILNCQNNVLSALDISSNVSLTDIDVSLNQLATLDLSANSTLQKLKCGSNRLSGLDVSANPDLTEIICSDNQIAALDITSNPLLSTFIASSNQITAMDVSANGDLTLVDLSDNQLATLDVSANSILEELTLSANQLTGIDVSQNDSLRNLRVGNNQLTALDLGSNQKLESFGGAANLFTAVNLNANPLLSSIDLSSNLITSIDLAPNTQLTSINVSSNLLQFLNVSNGNNAQINLFNALDNPNLSCIIVDDPGQIGDLWLKDTIASYSVSCDPIMTQIPDSNFEQALIDLGLDTGPFDGFVITDSINSIVLLDVSGSSITDMTGIADFSGLTNLNCSNNLLDTLDLTQNTLLTDVDCSDNLLISLNIKNGKNADLINLDARNNPTLTCITVDDMTAIGTNWQKDAGASYADNCSPGSTFIPDDNFEQALIDAGKDNVLDNFVLTAAIDTITYLDISGLQIKDLTGIEAFSVLDSLDCSSNLLFQIDISQNTTLTYLACFSNFINQLDVSANSNLVSLNTGDNRISQLDVSSNTLLEQLIIDSNFLTDIDLSANTSLQVINVNSNKISSVGFDLSGNTNLEEIYCAGNNLTSLDLSQNVLLTSLDVANNQTPDIDVSQNVLLESLNASRNFLSDLDLSANTVLDTLEVNANQLTSLDVTTNPLLEFISAENNKLTSVDVTNNAVLKTLALAGNDLPSIELASNVDLISLDLDDNELSALDVSSSPNLLDLSFNRNQVTTLNLTTNINLLNLSCDANDLTDLDVTLNTALLTLSAASNSMGSLELSSNVSLKSLSCNDNVLSALDVSANSDLESLSCTNNQIVDLDISLLPQLKSLSISENSLRSLNLKNGNNVSLEMFTAVNNPDLMCIEVDDANVIGEEWEKDVAATYNEDCRYTDTFIPDDNFESALAAITGEPDNNDNYIATAKISGLTSLDISGNNIEDLTGIRAFISLEVLNVSNNLLDTISLDALASLTTLDVGINNLDTIVLSGVPLLENLNISSNNIGSLTLDDIPQLVQLTCSNNRITELDLTANSNLTELICSTNSLTTLNVKNGNNANLITFDASGNPDLLCIEIDDLADIGGGWTKDDNTDYSVDCHYNEIYIPDEAFEQALISLGLDETSTGPLDGYIPTTKALQATTLNVSAKEITDLTGIEAFINLKNLNCSDNSITDLNIQNNMLLEVLNSSANMLTELDVTMNDSLRTLNVSGNMLTTLDISQNLVLRTLRFSSNELSGIDLRQNPSLISIEGQLNDLISVDANNGANGAITLFDLRNNPMLTCILVDDVTQANSYSGWFKDTQAFYKLICDDDDNDGVADVDDICPATPFGKEVDLFGCEVFSLPVDNFSILVTDETCREGNNGKINIYASEILPYIATLTSELDSVSNYEFGDKVEIRNVRAGQYELCISVEGEPDYSQCYSLHIKEPEDLAVFQTSAANGRVSLEMTGSDEYEIIFNGRTYKTNEDNVSLSLKQGLNNIRVQTANLCQGIFEQSIFYSGELSPFPNPFDHELNVGISSTQASPVRIDIYNISGMLKYSGIHSIEQGLLTINTSNLKEGIYFLEVVGGDDHFRFKVVKR